VGVLWTMAQIKRTKYLFFWMDDAPFLDIPLLLRGQVARTALKQLYAISILQSQEYPIALDELRILFTIPADHWVSASAVIEESRVSSDQLDRFARQGLLVTDEDDECLRELKRRDEQLASTQWNLYATLYHFMSKWRDVDVAAQFPANPEEWEESNSRTDEAFKSFIDRYGRPPNAFHSAANSLANVELPLLRRSNGVFEGLNRRKTTRAFDANLPLELNDLSLILYYTFGCHGSVPVFEDIVGLKKTSPSGGSLHPTEVYLLIMNVSGLEPGVYHYAVEKHRLELMIKLEQSDARKWGNEFTAGQSYPSQAQALFIMTSRFYRNFWKYRKHQKAYGVLLMDVGHLSQTFYLVCAELGLGAFITAAINSFNIESKLGLDGFTEGAIAICGCGAPAQHDLIDPQFTPYSPRKTQL
jgi:putative peptide maturation dehydrogenase